MKVGVIGVGALGYHHARLYAEMEGVELVGVHDRCLATSKSVAANFGCRSFASVLDLCMHVDAVSIAVPTAEHYGAAYLALKNDCHVLIEKPYAATVAECDALTALASSRDVIVHVGHVERFNPAVAWLRENMGKPWIINARRFAKYPPARSGEQPRGTDVSVVMDLMIHDIDAILSLVDSPLQLIKAGGVYDDMSAELYFTNGVTAYLHAKRNANEPQRTISVLKPSAEYQMDYQTQGGILASADGTKTPIQPASRNALADELAAFVACCQGGESLIAATAFEATAAVRVAKQIEECAGLSL